MVGYKALMSMANHGRHELLRRATRAPLARSRLLHPRMAHPPPPWPPHCSRIAPALLPLPPHGGSLLLQTGIISAQHALLLLESVLQKKARILHAALLAVPPRAAPPCAVFSDPVSTPFLPSSLVITPTVSTPFLPRTASTHRSKLRIRPTAFGPLVPVAHLRSLCAFQGKLPATERVVAEILQYIGPAGSEATSVLKVAAANSSANVLAMLLDWSHQEKKALDLQVRAATPSALHRNGWPEATEHAAVCLPQLVCVALAEACESDNGEAMQLLLGSWVGQCTALQAQPLLRAFAARGDATTVGKLLSRGAGATSMVAMDAKQRVQLASCGLAHTAGAAAQRTKVCHFA